MYKGISKRRGNFFLNVVTYIQTLRFKRAKDFRKNTPLTISRHNEFHLTPIKSNNLNSYDTKKKYIYINIYETKSTSSTHMLKTYRVCLVKSNRSSVLVPFLPLTMF